MNMLLGSKDSSCPLWLRCPCPFASTKRLVLLMGVPSSSGLIHVPGLFLASATTDAGASIFCMGISPWRRFDRVRCSHKHARTLMISSKVPTSPPTRPPIITPFKACDPEPSGFREADLDMLAVS